MKHPILKIRASFLIAGMILASVASAQTGDGYVGIYADSSGTTPCTSVPHMTGTTLFVIAKTAGASATGITGAEFRIEVTNPTGWTISFAAPPAATVVLGNPIDTNPDPDAGGGGVLAFASCQVPDASGQVPLGTLSVFNRSGGPTNLLLKRHSHPTNAGFACPLFVACDNPTFTKVCMTSAPPDSCTLGTQKATLATADDPTVFTASINEGGGDSGAPPSDPEREVLALFTAGVINLPPGQSYATLESTTINSPAVESVLASYSVESIAKAFPDFSPADTVAVTRTGETVQLQNLSEIYKLLLPEGGNPTLLAQDLAALTDDVGYADPNGYATPACVNDQYFASQYNLGSGAAGIKFCAARAITPGSTSTKIGIVDNGVDASHPDLTPKVSGDTGYNTDPRYVGHGTHVAGIAAANTNNVVGVAGVDGNAQIISQREDGRDDAGIAAAVRDAANLGSSVINNSWTLTDDNLDPPTPRYSDTVHGAFRDLYVRNCVATAAMGNSSDQRTYFPAGFAEVGIVAVGATNTVGQHADFSTTGPHIDVAAPGVSIWSTVPGGYAAFEGTSMATPHVSGLAGLLLAVNSMLYNDDIEQLIRLSADDKGIPDFDSETGMGLINAEGALNLLRYPYALYQLTATGGSSVSNTDWYKMWFYVPPGINNTGNYLVRRYEVRKNVTFPVTFQSTPNVWGRGVATRGYSGASKNWNVGWCEPVGTITPSGCTLRSFVYEVRSYPSGTFVGWWPTTVANVRFAYTAHGTVTVSDVGDLAGTTRLSFSSANPLRRGTTIELGLPQESRARVEVYDVAGRLVRVLHDGVLAPGRHALGWNGLSDRGKALPSGLYFARVKTETEAVTRKLLVLQ